MKAPSSKLKHFTGGAADHVPVPGSCVRTSRKPKPITCHSAPAAHSLTAGWILPRFLRFWIWLFPQACPGDTCVLLLAPVPCCWHLCPAGDTCALLLAPVPCCSNATPLVLQLHIRHSALPLPLSKKGLSCSVACSVIARELWNLCNSAVPWGWLEAPRFLPWGDISASPACHHQAVTVTNFTSVSSGQGGKQVWGSRCAAATPPRCYGQAGHGYQPCHGWPLGVPRAAPALCCSSLVCSVNTEPFFCPSGEHISSFFLAPEHAHTHRAEFWQTVGKSVTLLMSKSIVLPLTSLWMKSVHWIHFYWRYISPTNKKKIKKNHLA